MKKVINGVISLLYLVLFFDYIIANQRVLPGMVDEDEARNILAHASRSCNAANEFDVDEVVMINTSKIDPKRNENIYAIITAKPATSRGEYTLKLSPSRTNTILLRADKIYKVFAINPSDPFEWTKTCLWRLKEFNSELRGSVPYSIISFADLNKIIDIFEAKIKSSYANKNSWIDDDSPDEDFFNTAATEHNEFDCPFAQKQVVPSGSKVCFVGDIHGSVHSLLRMIWRLIAMGYVDHSFKIMKDNFYIVFNGDFVDRGRYGLEVWYTLLLLKLANWDTVFLLKGNHETRDCSDRYGFLKECQAKYGQEIKDRIYKIYRFLPHVLYLGSGDDQSFVQCCHGGIEPGFDPARLVAASNDQVFQKISLKVDQSCLGYDFHAPGPAKKNNYEGFNWSDFCQEYDKVGLTGKIFFNYSRGTGYIADVAGTDNYLSGQNKSIKAFFRGHQDTTYGFKMLFIPYELQSLVNRPTPLKDQLYKWVDVVNKATFPHDKNSDELLDHQDGFLIHKYAPVFTFTTATEGRGLEHDCFGILTTGQRYETWRLWPYMCDVDPNRSGKYCNIVIKEKLIEATWTDEPVISDMDKKLLDLKSSLARLGNNLKSLKLSLVALKNKMRS